MVPLAQQIQEAEDAAYAILEAAIRSGELLPNQRLVEQELMDAYGLTRGSIRVALVRLEQDGVVTRPRNRGARVRSVSADEAIEIIQVRASLEGLAARYAAERGSDEDIERLKQLGQEMEAAHDDGDFPAMSVANASVDQLIVAMADHRTLERLSRSLNSHMVRFQFGPGVISGRPDVSLAEHRAIIGAIVARDGEAAERAVRAHFDNVAETMQRRLASASARAPRSMV
jgi:DNA-binding GntR family transcriptional regulator